MRIPSITTAHQQVAAGFLACCLAAAPTSAQDRMPPIPADKLTPEQQRAIDAFKVARGQDAAVGGPFIPLLRSPEVMQRARAMGDYLRYKSALPPRLSEFVILLTARHWTQQYEWGLHYPFAIKGGVKPEVAKAIAEGKRPTQMADDEAALYDLCSELQQRQRVEDATYKRAVAQFGEKGVIDAIAIVGYYSMLAMVLNVAQTPGITPPDVPVLMPHAK
jgi:4-carboxymuconolactone decarboxylase